MVRRFQSETRSNMQGAVCFILAGLIHAKVHIHAHPVANTLLAVFLACTTTLYPYDSPATGISLGEAEQ